MRNLFTLAFCICYFASIGYSQILDTLPFRKMTSEEVDTVYDSWISNYNIKEPSSHKEDLPLFIDRKQGIAIDFDSESRNYNLTVSMHDSLYLSLKKLYPTESYSIAVFKVERRDINNIGQKEIIIQWGDTGSNDNGGYYNDTVITIIDIDKKNILFNDQSYSVYCSYSDHEKIIYSCKIDYTKNNQITISKEKEEKNGKPIPKSSNKNGVYILKDNLYFVREQKTKASKTSTIH